MNAQTHVFVNSNSPDEAVLTLIDACMETNTTLLDHRTYRVETHLGAEAIANSQSGIGDQVAYLDSVGRNVYHIVATLRA
jgi:hypothetical protein